MSEVLEEDIVLPSNILSYSDETFNDIAENLRQRGFMDEDEAITGITLDVQAEEGVVAQNVMTEKMVV